MRITLACLCLCLMVGCSSNKGPAQDDPKPAAPAPAAPAPAAPAAAAATGDMQACNADADCEVVEVGCCDHCNGGKVISVAKPNVAAATAKYKATNCSGACTERACLGNEAV